MSEKTITGHGGGGKGGGGGHTPHEDPDSLHSISKARVLDLISEGEIEGLVNGMESVFLNDTPLLHEGRPNFEGLLLSGRVGTQDQDPIPGVPAVENGMPVEVTVKSITPWVRDFTNMELTSVRVQLAVPQLQQITSKGDITGLTIEYAIDVSSDGGPYKMVLNRSVSGKTTTKYTRSHDIVLPAATSRRTIRVRRLTPDFTSSKLSGLLTIEAVTEIVEGKFSYPNSAIIGIEVSSEQFQSIPRRAYHVRGIKVKVPTNYNPVTRGYGGTWDGSWKTEWTNNPAWIFMDVATNPRYGVGDRIKLAHMDKWALYDIARYCDQMVPDGFGGTEPRFTCNGQVMDRTGAYELMQNLASIFQGMAYYATGIITAVADQPKDAVAVYTNSDVVDGMFSYSGTPKSTRYTVALVGWQNPKNFSKQEVEYVADHEGLLRYGYQETQLTAFLCSSRGQAHRAGKWALLTSQLETQTCTFKVGLKGLKARPGDLVRVMDQDLIGEMKGGLIVAATDKSITTDCDFEAVPGDTVFAMLPSGIAQKRTIQAVSGRVITVTQKFTETPQAHGSWGVDGAVRLQTYRVLSVTEGDEDFTFEIKCLEYREDKYDAIANNMRLDARPVTSIPPSIQPPPSNVQITQRTVVHQGIANFTATISWEAADKAIAYEGHWRRDEGEWVPLGRTGGTLVEIPNIHEGRYVARVRAINALGIRSVAATSVETHLEGKTTPPPVVSHLDTEPTLWGIDLKWGFPAEGSEDVQRSEVWYSVTPQRADATKLTDLAYPQAAFSLSGLQAAKTLYFWVRLVDRSGNYGDYYPDGDGVKGTSGDDASEYLEVIKDEVFSSELGKQLLKDVKDNNKALHLMLDAERRIREDEDVQVAQKVEDLRVEVDEDIEASVAETKTALANATEAMAINALELSSSVHSDVNAQISALQQTFADANQALATSQTQLSSKVGNYQSQVQTVSSTMADKFGQLSSMYTLKTQVSSMGERYVAGIGLGVENDPNGPGFISQILLQADRLALISTTSEDITTPFVIDNGQTFIDSALIKEASITRAKIKDGEITNLKLGPDAVSVEKVINQAIERAKIQDNAVSEVTKSTWLGPYYNGGVKHQKVLIYSRSLEMPVMGLAQVYVRVRAKKTSGSYDPQNYYSIDIAGLARGTYSSNFKTLENSGQWHTVNEATLKLAVVPAGASVNVYVNRRHGVPDAQEEVYIEAFRLFK